MFDWEKKIIRELAKQKLEISNLPIMHERKKEWTLHNDLNGKRPMIHFEMGSVGDIGFNFMPKCESEDAKLIEIELGTSIWNHKMIGDDRVVTPEFVCKYHNSLLPFSMPVKKTHTDGVGFHIESQIDDLEDMSVIKPSSRTYDMQASIDWKDKVEDLIGDILTVRFGMNSLYVCMTNDIVHRMSMENMFMAMYDTPDEFHIMMNLLSDDYVAHIKDQQKLGMLVNNNKNDHLAQGSFGFSDSLPDVATKSTDCWGYLDSQETVGISKDMFHEFFFPYYKKVAEQYGLLSYGCCEPVSEFWEKSISNFSNLRKISISPWCDEEYMGAQLKGRGVIYLRKPSPNYIGIEKELDENSFREHIRKTVKAANGCPLEIAFRDIYNLSGNLEKPRRAVEIVREETNR